LLACGLIRVVRVDEPARSRAFFRPEVSGSVADILTAIVGGSSVRKALRDGKEVVGVGQQPVRLAPANIAAFHLGLGPFTMSKTSSRGQEADELADRSASPWDDQGHADKRGAWRRTRLREEIRAVLRPGVTAGGIQAHVVHLLSLAA
jgi:hypothetical protein